MSSLFNKIARNPQTKLRVVQDTSRRKSLVYFEPNVPVGVENKNASAEQRGMHTIWYMTMKETLILFVDEQRTCDLVLKWLNEDKCLPEKVIKQFPHGYEHLAQCVPEARVELAFEPRDKNAPQLTMLGGALTQAYVG